MAQQSAVISSVNEQATAMAVAWQLKHITDQAQRELNRAPKRPARCNLCKGAHATTTCETIPQQEKLPLLKTKGLCVLCGNYNNHHPVTCHNLRTKNHGELCHKRVCGKKFELHHKNFCTLKQNQLVEGNLNVQQLLMEDQDQ
ncbi:hypothetical protein CAEBREN_20349 [Caenorhabditis brenneri]|uniref:Uncharacterized protein n=1 Tax=Caenorhabditis brenneri TaxID=135651 RepID=G0NGJ1_CAEBE|nr:hypothetical protein CAEBREN_20349 [Caenorhabditis brenneri]